MSNHLLDHLPSERERRYQEELHDLYKSGHVVMRFANGKLEYLGTEATRLRERYERKA